MYVIVMSGTTSTGKYTLIAEKKYTQLDSFLYFDYLTNLFKCFLLSRTKFKKTVIYFKILICKLSRYCAGLSVNPLQRGKFLYICTVLKYGLIHVFIPVCTNFPLIAARFQECLVSNSTLLHMVPPVMRRRTYCLIFILHW